MATLTHSLHLYRFRVNVPTATSKSVLLKNMFNPAEETEPDWDTELRDDVKSECEDKYGRVVEIHVDRDSAVSLHTSVRVSLEWDPS